MSNYYLEFVEDSQGDLVDVLYFHRSCASDELKALGSWPCPEFSPDYSTYCAGCDECINAVDES